MCSLHFRRAHDHVESTVLAKRIWPAYLLPGTVVSSIVLGMEYFFADASIQGRLRSGEYPFAVGVLEAPKNSVPRGIAFEVGRTADGLAKWKLKVHGIDVPGRFIIDNGRFVPIEDVPG
jgi:hypothetical protein